MNDVNSKLEAFDNEKLIDIVKNYRQYGYDDVLRNKVVKILEQRGLSKEMLKLTGDFENSSYKAAEEMHKTFSRNSIITFILYGIVLLSNILVSVFSPNTETIGVLMLIINWMALIAFIVFFMKSFINQRDFYTIIGKETSSNDILIYFFIGMPLYVVAYFYFRSRMNDEMKLIK